MSRNKVYITLGTNIGNWKNNFNQSFKLLNQFCLIKRFSSFYLSHPYGYKNQDFFYNMAIELETNLTPPKLFDKLQQIEKKLQKNKLIVNGPRRIDLDIIFFNQLIFKSKKLIIPHYAAHLRDFVLLPLIEIKPFYMHPVRKETISSIYKKIKDKYVFKIKQRQKESSIIY